MPRKPKSREFHAQTQKLLDLMIHSVYSEKEVFLRELISNSSDAIDKVRFLAQTDPELATGDHDYKIKLSPNSEEGTLEISDNGIGMSFELLQMHAGPAAEQTFFLAFNGYWAQFLVSLVAILIGRATRASRSHGWPMVRLLL